MTLDKIFRRTVACFTLVSLANSSAAYPASKTARPYDDQEAEVFAKLFSGELISELSHSYCINATLGPMQFDDFNRLLSIPAEIKRSSEGRTYLRVVKEFRKHPSGTTFRQLTLADLDKGGEGLKHSSYQRCIMLPVYKFNRALIYKGHAVVPVYYNTNCRHITSAISFSHRKGAWHRVGEADFGGHIGPPGCSAFDNDPGAISDTYFERVN